jgi:hypothetical protein
MAKATNWLDRLFIGDCALALLGIALYLSRKVRRHGHVLLSARWLSRWPIAISIYVAQFSTIGFLGYTGWVRDGRLQTIGTGDAEPEIERGVQLYDKPYGEHNPPAEYRIRGLTRRSLPAAIESELVAKVV